MIKTKRVDCLQNLRLHRCTPGLMRYLELPSQDEPLMRRRCWRCQQLLRGMLLRLQSSLPGVSFRCSYSQTSSDWRSTLRLSISKAYSRRGTKRKKPRPRFIPRGADHYAAKHPTSPDFHRLSLPSCHPSARFQSCNTSTTQPPYRSLVSPNHSAAPPPRPPFKRHVRDSSLVNRLQWLFENVPLHLS